jgi:hypothetical protein
VWTKWYEDRLAGRVQKDERELAFVSIADDLWDQGPAIVNAEIKRRIEELERPQVTAQLSASVSAVASGRAFMRAAEPPAPAPGPSEPSPGMLRDAQAAALAIIFGVEWFRRRSSRFTHTP